MYWEVVLEACQGYRKLTLKYSEYVKGYKVKVEVPEKVVRKRKSNQSILVTLQKPPECEKLYKKDGVNRIRTHSKNMKEPSTVRKTSEWRNYWTRYSSYNIVCIENTHWWHDDWVDWASACWSYCREFECQLGIHVCLPLCVLLLLWAYHLRKIKVDENETKVSL